MNRESPKTRKCENAGRVNRSSFWLFSGFRAFAIELASATSASCRLKQCRRDSEVSTSRQPIRQSRPRKPERAKTRKCENAGRVNRSSFWLFSGFRAFAIELALVASASCRLKQCRRDSEVSASKQPIRQSRSRKPERAKTRKCENAGRVNRSSFFGVSGFRD